MIHIPEQADSVRVPVYDGHATRHGYRIPGPALVEQVNTTLFVSSSYDCLCDRYGSFVVFLKGTEKNLALNLAEPR